MFRLRQSIKKIFLGLILRFKKTTKRANKKSIKIIKKLRIVDDCKQYKK